MTSTSCDLCTNGVWNYYVKSFRRRSIYKKIQYWTFDLDLRVKVTRNVAQYPLHHVTYSATKFEVATPKGLGGDAFTRKFNIWPWPWVKVTRNVAQYPLHHVTYLATKFAVATSKGLGGDAITRKFNIWPLTLTLGSRSHEMLPSTLYIVWPIQLQSFKLLCRTV